MLLKNPAVAPLRELVNKRLLEPSQLVQAHKQLNQMLVTLWTAGYIQLDPKPTPLSRQEATPAKAPSKDPTLAPPPAKGLLTSAGLGNLVSHAQSTRDESRSAGDDASDDDETAQDAAATSSLQLERDDEASRAMTWKTTNRKQLNQPSV